MNYALSLCCLLFSLNAAAQEPATTDSIRPQETTHSFMGRIQELQQYLDARARARVDSNYIEVPEKPWRVILRLKETVVDVDYDNCVTTLGTDDRVDWNLHFNPPTSASVGFWAGYRGLGLSYATSLVKNAGRHFSLGATGAKYGFNVRLRRFNTDETTLTSKTILDGKMAEESKEDGQLNAPVLIRSVYINGYYVFNGRRYSQAAAYNQSVIQRRSAGSFLLGATWYQSSFDYSNKKNAEMILLSNNVNRIKLHQANIGFGYGYNLVPFRGFVINAMAMPTLSFYNRVKVYKYDSNFTLFDSEEYSVEDYGTWDPQTHTWANGKKQLPLAIVDFESDWVSYVDFWEGESETTYGRVQFNVDLRLGIAYNWSNYFVGFQAQFNRFSYRKDLCKVSLYDAYARLSLGVRL